MNLRAEKSVDCRAESDVVVRDYVSDLRDALSDLDLPSVAGLVEQVVDALRGEGRVLLAGNGGSAAACAHMSLDWTTAMAVDGETARVVDLAASSAVVTALGNDVSFDSVFANQIRAMGDEGDVLLLLSVSGASPNLVEAAVAAREHGIRVLGLLGHAGPVYELCDEAAIFGMADYGLTEDLHLSFNHMIARLLRGGGPHRCAVSAVGTDEASTRPWAPALAGPSSA